MRCAASFSLIVSVISFPFLCCRRSQSHREERRSGVAAPAARVPDQAVVIGKMDSVSVYQVERLGTADRLPATGTKIPRDVVAVLGMPSVFQFAPRQGLGLGSGVKPTTFPMRGPFFVEI